MIKYASHNDIKMKTIYENIWQYLETNNEHNMKQGWNPKSLAMKFFEEKVEKGNSNPNMSKNLTDREDLIYGNAIWHFYFKLMAGSAYGMVLQESRGDTTFNWTTENIGTFLVNLLHKKRLLFIP